MRRTRRWAAFTGRLRRGQTIRWRGFRKPPKTSLPRVLRTLATVSTGTDQAATARTVPLHSFPEGSDSRTLVDALIAARLLVASSDGAEPTVRFAHEALINRWERASQLLASSRRDLETRALIEQQQARWSLASSANRHMLLLRDFDLATALDLDKRSGSELTPSLRSYVAQSATAAKAAARRKQAVVATVFVVLLAFAAASFGSLLIAKRQRDTALIAESDFLARELAQRGGRRQHHARNHSRARRTAAQDCQS